MKNILFYSIFLQHPNPEKDPMTYFYMSLQFSAYTVYRNKFPGKYHFHELSFLEISFPAILFPGEINLNSGTLKFFFFYITVIYTLCQSQKKCYTFKTKKNNVSFMHIIIIVWIKTFNFLVSFYKQHINNINFCYCFFFLNHSIISFLF